MVVITTDMYNNRQETMELELEKIKFLENYMIPHIALTTCKYRAKAGAIFRALNVDITIDQFIILKVLSGVKKLTQQELSEVLYKDKSNLSRMVESLNKKGYLTRMLDIKDNRAVKNLELTAAGYELTEKLSIYAMQVQKNVIEDITQEELDTVKNVMKKIRDNLNKKIEVEKL